MSNTSKPLKIYNASAGSGKTYHLVKEYINLLIGDINSKSFSSIIAMTFTNKAALEMKERIIKALDEIGNPEQFNFSSESLAQEIAQDLNISSSEVQKRCRFVLKNILHQYEDFHVMTIDKFNLRLIRSFSRDLDLPNDFEVVLDEQEVIEKIVDELLSQLGSDNTSNLNKLLLKYAETKVDDGESWNIRTKLVEFGKILRFEQNADKVKKLLSSDFTLERFGSVIQQRKTLDKKAVKYITQLLEALTETPLEAKQIPGGNTTLNGIKKLTKLERFPLDSKLINKSLINSLDVELKKTHFYPDNIKEAIRKIVKLREEHIEEYILVDLFLKNFFNMALLQYMARALDHIKKEEQIILISEFNALISNLIQKEHAPFIYERLGSKYNHFLLDEFQDTSHLQWLNLVPLVHEALGTGQANLIVGDPKQSIYRFKNGVAEQFVQLPKIYNPEKDQNIAEKSQFFNEMGETFSLKNNWRSSPTIVNFNNAFFNNFKQQLPEESLAFYNSVEQTPMSRSNGVINIESKEIKSKDKDPDQIIEKIISWIDECKADGFNYGDIAILGNKNKDCNSWAIALTERGYKVVSSESLLINSNIKVQLAIAYLQWRFSPSHESSKRQFAELFFRHKQDTYSTYKTYIEEKTSKYDKKYKQFNENQFINDYFIGYTSFFFKYESIYDLIQGFYKLIGFNELNNPYLHHLADYIYDFELKKGPHLGNFLEEFNRGKDKIAVQVPESTEAVQIMTIHKSKGLEFPVVLIPTLNSAIDVKASFLVEVDDFIVYKKPSKNEEVKELKEVYDKEYNQVITDLVNLTYVALTRPVERLYIQNYYENNRFGKLFHKSLETIDGVVMEGDTLTYLKSDGERTKPKAKKSDSLPFTPKDIKEKLWFPDISLQDNLEVVDNKFLSSEMQFGLQFHLVVSKVENISEIKGVMNQLVQSGEIELSLFESLFEKVQALFSSVDYAQLFEGKVDVINEQAILVDANTTLRPDKIIIKEGETIILDYKTGVPNSKDNKQVALYKQIIEEMGYPNVSCYLFYSSLNELRLV